MKYSNFKIFKFSTILKNISNIYDYFLKISKNIKPISNYIVKVFILITKYIYSVLSKGARFIIKDFSKIYKSTNTKLYNLFRNYRYFNYRYFDFRRYNFAKIYRYLDFRTYNFSIIYRYFNFGKYKYISFYILGALVLTTFIYLSVPLFFNYDKSKIANLICKDFNTKCSIKGEIKYGFLPTPRIKITDLIIQDFTDKKRILGKIEKTVIKAPIFNLLKKNKLNFNKIDLINAVISFDLNKLKKYKNFSSKKFKSKNINLKKSEIIFYDGNKNIATINNVNFKYKFDIDNIEANLKGIFLDDKIYINFNNKKKEINSPKVVVLKLLDSKLYTKIEIFDSEKGKNINSGNISFKKNRNKISGIFEYQDNKIFIKKANLRNGFLDGKINGLVEFLPYFNFNLNLDLNSVNFNRFYSSLVTLKSEDKKNLFKINKKINGQLNLSADKIFSKHTFIDSFESRIRFINGNIFFEQLLLNLKKIGAADITGIIKNDKKITNFKFENNIFIDNLKSFYNRFGIHNKQKIPSNLFVSGNLDLINFNLRLNEISGKKKFTEEDISYIEKEFNNIILLEDYASLFDFLKLKEFVRSVTLETN